MAGEDHSRYHILAVAALAGATLLLEGAWLRLLAVAQFYHFAFLVVSLALLGFGASGSLLAVSSPLQRTPTDRLLAYAGIGVAVSTALAYAVVNFLPFDSYSIAWERVQLLYFVLYYLALSLPFLCSGLGIGAALARGERSHLIYAANLVGSAAGALLSLAVLWLAGVPGAVLAAALLGLAPALRRPFRRPVTAVLMVGMAGLLVLSGWNLQGRAPLGMSISPYKGLAYALRYPGARPLFERWNAFSRVDVVAEAGTRQLPGLSYAYPGMPPPQHGLSVDAGARQPVTLAAPEAFAAAAFLPEALAFALRPGADALVLEPGAGLGVLQALAGGARRVTAVVGNPLVRDAVQRTAPDADVYAHPRVRTVLETGRVFLQRESARYDLVFLPLTDAYQPVSSGAYSLAETYDLTVEALAQTLARLETDGLLVVSRWLQTPPSESLRLIGTVVEALSRRGMDRPGDALVVYRGVQTVTVLVQPDGWNADELGQVRAFLAERRYDLVWAPDVDPAEVNRTNRLPEPVYYAAVRTLLTTPDRRRFYADYPFAIVPATDDHPFFFHFFTWAQTPEVLATLGRTWQPFGGSGYFVLLALLALALLLSGGLIAAPLLVGPLRRTRGPDPALSPSAPLQDPISHTLRRRALLYFALLGLAFLFVEIPLIQSWILLLGHPAYAFTAVVTTLLFFSGMGSALARRSWLPWGAALGTLALLALLTPFVVKGLATGTLGLPFSLRAALAVLSLAPLGMLMGLPFPLGLAWLEAQAPGLVPWAWAINGCASVIASVLAAILGLSYGFTLVLLLGAAAYAGALYVVRNVAKPQPRA